MMSRVNGTERSRPMGSRDSARRRSVGKLGIAATAIVLGASTVAVRLTAQAPIPQVAPPRGAVQIQVQAQGGPGQAPPRIQVGGNVQIGGQVQIQVQGGGAVQVQFAQQAGAGPFSANDGNDTGETVFREPPRELLQRFKRSETLIQEKRYAEAVEMLGGILEEAEDYAFSGDDPSLRKSLKTEARRRIGALPADGRAAYELQYGAKALQMLEAGVARGDETALAEVSRRYFHTAAGYQATYLLGVAHLDHQRPLAAALCLRRLREVAAAESWEPQLSVLLATAWMRAGSTTDAAAVLDDLKRRRPSAEFEVGGQSRRVFGGSEQAAAWLGPLTVGHGAVEPAGDRRSVEWVMFRGDARRNAVGVGGSPLLNRRWAVPLVNHPQIERVVRQKAEHYAQQEDVLLPSANPLAVDDLVLVRNLGGVTAVDFRTGKRLWRGAANESVETLLDRDAPLSSRGEQNSARLTTLVDDLVWRDATLGNFSSDGRRVFCVEQTTPPAADPNVQRRVILANGRHLSFADGAETNRLAAYDLSTQGKLLWEFGGAPESDPAATDMFVLGAPLPLGDRLYLLGESRGEVRLVVLHAATGKVDWTQQLLLADEAASPSIRRSSALSPSYADGILICPTAAGGVVAVDLNDRSLLWGHQYPRGGDQDRRRQGIMAWQLNGRGDGLADADRWQDGTAVVADGRVLVTPPDSQFVHCLRLLDGQLLWKQPRAKGLFVGCLANDEVLVVGASEIQAYAAADGKARWSVAYPEAARPSGRGFFNGRYYFQPLTSAEVAALDVAARRFTARSRSRSGAVPGNLICYRGSILSQGAEGVECFFQIEDLRRDVLAQLQKNPDDPAALASHGELLLDEGKVREAIDALRKSHRATPETRTRTLLVDALLEGLKGGVAATADDATDLESLIVGTDRQELYLRLKAQAHEQAGRTREAFATYLRLVDLPTDSSEALRLNGDVSIRRERWVKSRLDELAASADEATVADLRTEIDCRREKIEADGDPATQRRFLAYFGDDPGSQSMRLKLAVKASAVGDALEAETLLRTVAARGGDPTAREAVARLAHLLIERERGSDALGYVDRLANEFANETCLEGKTGRELADVLRPDAEAQSRGANRAWPAGRVDVKESKTQGIAHVRSVPLEFRGPRGPYFADLTIEMDQSQQAILGKDDLGNERWRVSLAPDDRRNVNHFNQLISHVRADGHLLIVSLGTEIVAVDTLGKSPQGGARVVWRRELTDSLPGMNIVQGINQRMVQMPWGVPRFMAHDAFGKPIGVTGPATLRYVSFLKQRTLQVVDPLTGEALWIRHNTAPGSELFGDERHLFVTPPDGGESLLLSAADGREIRRLELPTPDERVASYGRKLLTWKAVAGRMRLALYDALEEKELWRHDFPASARLWPVDADEAAVVDRSGRFVVVSAADGALQIDARIQPEPNLTEAYVFRTADAYLLIPNTPFRHREGINIQPISGHYGNPLINGYLYGFDRKTKKQIFRTRVPGHGLSLQQPGALPMLVFASQVYEQPRNGQVRGPHAILLCIDKRTGRMLYDKQLSSPLQGIDISTDAARHRIAVQTFRDKVEFTFTDEPLPEASDPAQPKEIGALPQFRGKGVGDSIVDSAAELGRALREVQKEIDRNRAGGGAAPAVAPPADPAKPRE